MRYESQGSTELDVLPRGIESILIDDLCLTSDTGFKFRERVLRLPSNSWIVLARMTNRLLKGSVRVTQNWLPSMRSPL